ncbi:MAG: peptide chain release factor N(5)-glutamine methyltransferase [Acidobacteria bacterium]|nr:peptide chain release factor N(5)-glutamine methyltransferase [Acidobacteriota bacterium]
MNSLSETNPTNSAPRTIAQVVTEGANFLRENQVSDERLTASLLLEQALGVDRTQLIIRANEVLDEALRQTFRALLERRAAGEPLQYILGHQEFYGLDFRVTKAVLIPRPETEFLIEQVLKLSQTPAELDCTEPFRRTANKRKRAKNTLPSVGDTTKLSAPAWLIVDIGTGSGCIAITLARHLKTARLIATDSSSAALAIAQENAARLGAQERIEFLHGDLLAPLAGRGLENRIDFLVSNPPYVARQEAATLQREVINWEPHAALFADEDGLQFYRRLLAESHGYVKPEGFLICEIGYTQLDAIRQMIDPNLWRLEDVTNDLQGIPRILTMRRIA